MSICELCGDPMCDFCSGEKSNNQQEEKFCFFCENKRQLTKARNGYICSSCYGHFDLYSISRCILWKGGDDIPGYNGSIVIVNSPPPHALVRKCDALFILPTTDEVVLNDIPRFLVLGIASNTVSINNSSVSELRIDAKRGEGKIILKNINFDHLVCNANETLISNCNGHALEINGSTCEIDRLSSTSMGITNTSKITLKHASIRDAFNFVSETIIMNETRIEKGMVTATGLAKIFRCNILGKMDVLGKGYFIDSNVAIGRGWDSDRLFIRGGHVRKYIMPTCDICDEIIEGHHIIHKEKTIHAYCWEKQSSSRSNAKKQGDTDSFPTFSIELELNGNETEDNNYNDLIYKLLKNGFIRCDDGTVCDEFKSPIYVSFDSFLKHKFLYEEAIPYTTDDARTHVHVGADDYTKEWYSSNRDIVFYRLEEWLEDYREDTEYFFGCYFSGLCASRYSGDRFTWINFQSRYSTIEYRLARLYNIEQYIHLVDFFRKFTVFLSELIGKTPADRYRYPKVKGKMSEEILNFYQQYLQERNSKNV